MPATKDYFRQAVGCLIYGFMRDGLSSEKMIEVLDEITDGYYNPPIENPPPLKCAPDGGPDDLSGGKLSPEDEEALSRSLTDYFSIGVTVVKPEASQNEGAVQQSNE